MKTFTQLFLTIFFGVLLGGVQTPLFSDPAPVFDADHLAQTSDNSMVDRVQHLEQQMNALYASSNAGNNSSNNNTQVESLQGEVQALRNQVEQLSHQLQTVEADQQTLSNHLETRLTSKVSDTPKEKEQSNTLETADATHPANTVRTTHTSDSAQVSPKKTSPTQEMDASEEQQSYQAAYNLIKAKKYNDAENTLHDMIKKYPNGQFASNAHYWLGELYGLTGKNELALQEFRVIVSHFPKSARAADARAAIEKLKQAQSVS